MLHAMVRLDVGETHVDEEVPPCLRRGRGGAARAADVRVAGAAVPPVWPGGGQRRPAPLEAVAVPTGVVRTLVVPAPGHARAATGAQRRHGRLLPRRPQRRAVRGRCWHGFRGRRGLRKWHPPSHQLVHGPLVAGPRAVADGAPADHRDCAGDGRARGGGHSGPRCWRRRRCWHRRRCWRRRCWRRSLRAGLLGATRCNLRNTPRSAGGHVLNREVVQVMVPEWAGCETGGAGVVRSADKYACRVTLPLAKRHRALRLCG
mmetsp:Transcript_90388/g.239159  ORF Transcript_90388/g.239159 Transcript_90388/m.239159 type:complete len:260 (+) Transcript_90388:269-1048(+)